MNSRTTRTGSFHPAQTVVLGAARAAAKLLKPQIDQLHRHAEQVVEKRRSLIESNTDPNQRRMLR